MYEAFFGMTHTPFTRDLPPECLYETKAMSDVLGRLMYVADKKLFAVITSEPGCGKSTLLRKFDAMLPKDEYILLYLSDSKLTPKWFYKGLLEQLGIDSGFYRGDAKRQLQASIEIIQGVQKKRVVCILDEAHLLDKEMLEEFRFILILSYYSGQEALLPVCLFFVAVIIRGFIYGCSRVLSTLGMFFLRQLEKHFFQFLRDRQPNDCAVFQYRNPLIRQIKEDDRRTNRRPVMNHLGIHNVCDADQDEDTYLFGDALKADFA